VSETLWAALAGLAGDEITALVPVGGGCIAQAFRVTTGSGRQLFAKTGSNAVAETFPGEAEGLRALAKAAPGLRIPEVIGLAPGVLLLEWLWARADNEVDASSWRDLAAGLCQLHRGPKTSPSARPSYGFRCDNHIGATPQKNTRTSDWVTFFRDCRLQPQCMLARKNGVWERTWDAPFDRLLKALDDRLPSQPSPSLVHGDLWSGNLMFTHTGQPAIFDPAAYYGHREVDLAMAKMFGGFPDVLYAAYHEHWPLAPGSQDRARIYNLYHELNHLNLFGRSYTGMVAATLHALA